MKKLISRCRNNLIDTCKQLYGKLCEQYQGIYDDLLLYCHSYGGWTAFVTSPYLHISIVITVIACPTYVCPKEPFWYSLPLSVLPNLLGFTLGGYAILLAFGDDKFKSAIASKEPDGEPTYYMTMNGAFIHFILLQAITIIVAALGSIWVIKTGPLAWVGFCLFVYSVLSAVAAAMAVLNTADLFQSLNNRE